LKKGTVTKIINNETAEETNADIKSDIMQIDKELVRM